MPDSSGSGVCRSWLPRRGRERASGDSGEFGRQEPHKLHHGMQPNGGSRYLFARWFVLLELPDLPLAAFRFQPPSKTKARLPLSIMQQTLQLKPFASNVTQKALILCMPSPGANLRFAWPLAQCSPKRFAPDKAQTALAFEMPKQKPQHLVVHWRSLANTPARKPVQLKPLTQQAYHAYFKSHIPCQLCLHALASLCLLLHPENPSLQSRSDHRVRNGILDLTRQNDCGPP